MHSGVFTTLQVATVFVLYTGLCAPAAGDTQLNICKKSFVTNLYHACLPYADSPVKKSSLLPESDEYWKFKKSLNSDYNWWPYKKRSKISPFWEFSRKRALSVVPFWEKTYSRSTAAADTNGQDITAALESHLHECLVRFVNNKTTTSVTEHDDATAPTVDHSQAIANIYMDDSSVVSMVAEIVCNDGCQGHPLRDLL